MSAKKIFSPKSDIQDKIIVEKKKKEEHPNLKK